MCETDACQFSLYSLILKFWQIAACESLVTHYQKRKVQFFADKMWETDAYQFSFYSLILKSWEIAACESLVTQKYQKKEGSILGWQNVGN